MRFGFHSCRLTTKSYLIPDTFTCKCEALPLLSFALSTKYETETCPTDRHGFADNQSATKSGTSLKISSSVSRPKDPPMFVCFALLAVRGLALQRSLRIPQMIVFSGILVFLSRGKVACSITGGRGCEVAGRFTKMVFEISVMIYPVG